jgi:hypothetical protein
LDAPEHVDSGNIKFKIGRRSSVYQLFSKRDLKIHKMWLKLGKIVNTVKNETFSKKSKNSIFGHFLPISAIFIEVKSRFEKSW